MNIRRPSSIVIITVAVSLMLVIGIWYAYLAPHERSSSAGIVGDSAVYGLESRGEREYRAVLIDNGSYVPVTELYLFHDGKFASEVNEDTDQPIGSPAYTQMYFLQQMESYLSFKGMHSMRFVDTAQALDIFAEQMRSDTCAGKGILFACGSVPSLLFDGEEGPLPEWIHAGGSMYWVGNEIGKFVSFGGETRLKNMSRGLTGVKDLSFGDGTLADGDGPFRRELSLQDRDLLYAPDGTGVRHFGFTDGTYSTVSCIGKGAGQICVMSGDFSMNLCKDLSNVICSGLSDESLVVGYDEGTFRDSVSGSMQLPATYGRLSIYLYVGAYHSIYGERHDLW